MTGNVPACIASGISISGLSLRAPPTAPPSSWNRSGDAETEAPVGAPGCLPALIDTSWPLRALYGIGLFSAGASFGSRVGVGLGTRARAASASVNGARSDASGSFVDSPAACGRQRLSAFGCWVWCVAWSGML